jgi:hypothetical protein
MNQNILGRTSRIEQTAAVVTVIAGGKIRGRSRAKTRASLAFGRTHRQLIRGVKKPTERADSDTQKKNFLSCHRRNG